MLKKIDFPYVVFLVFVFFILFSFYFILKTNENTKNNYQAIEKAEQLLFFNNKFENILSTKLQYLDTKKTSESIYSFENELKILKSLLLEKEISSDILSSVNDIEVNFAKKKILLEEYREYNQLLVQSMQKLLSIQAYIQKRYYFSPIGLEVNAVIVNFTQAALGKSEYISNIKKNIKAINNLKKMYKLADRQLITFLENSHITLGHLDSLKNVIKVKKDIHLSSSIKKLEESLLEHFKSQSKKETNFSYILVITIICFLIALVITYEIDKKHKKKLLEQTLKLNEAQEYAHLGSWEVDLLDEDIYFSDEMYKIVELSFSKKRIDLNNIIKLIHPKDKTKVIKSVLSSQKKGNDGYIIHKVLTKKKKIKYVENRWHNQYDINGKLVKIFGVILDITNAKKLEQENKRKEEIMYQQSKMVAMGEMIGNIAHQWRQPLSVISTSATGMKLHKEFGLLDDKEFIKTMDLINDNAQYLSETINDFKNFIKGDKEIIVYNINDTINSFLHLITPSIKSYHINLIQKLKSDINIEGHPNELIQCFINIFNNSKDALQKIDIEERLFFIRVQERNENLVIEFRDNAGGIPKKVISRVFEPYFTTKHKSQGTGLGLHMTYQIIESMNGIIEAHNVNFQYNSKSYKGAEFIIKLPLKI